MRSHIRLRLIIGFLLTLFSPFWVSATVVELLGLTNSYPWEPTIYILCTVPLFTLGFAITVDAAWDLHHEAEGATYL